MNTLNRSRIIPNKLKICQLCNVGFALNKFLLPLVDAQLRDGHDVVAVCAHDEYVFNLRERGYRVETLAFTRGMNPIKHIASIWAIYWFMKREKFDLVHVHTPVASILGRIAASLCGVSLVVYTAHGFYFHEDMPKFKKRFFITLERIMGRVTDLLFTQSKEDAITAVSERIMPSESVFAIGNGVDISRFIPFSKFNNNSKNNIRDELNIPKQAYIIGMIGRQVEEKGIIELLESAISLVSKYTDIYFLIIGDRLSSDHSGKVDKEIYRVKLLLGVKLVLTGMRDDIPELLSEIDVFVLPSWREGMPRTIIEAMMMGVPVVATDIRGSREEVIHEVTGLLVPVCNPKALTGAIESLYQNKNKANIMGQNGRIRALELYDESKVIERQLMLISNFWQKANGERFK